MSHFSFLTGGHVSSGLAIYDTMQYLNPPIATWCVGTAASMGAFLLAAGSPGLRHALPNSTIMLHQVLGGATVTTFFTIIIIRSA